MSTRSAPVGLLAPKKSLANDVISSTSDCIETMRKAQSMDIFPCNYKSKKKLGKARHSISDTMQNMYALFRSQSKKTLLDGHGKKLSKKKDKIKGVVHEIPEIVIQCIESGVQNQIELENR